MSTRQKGFTRLELLIVVAIIVSTLSIAIPRLLRSKMASDEAIAVGALRTEHQATGSRSTGSSGAGYRMVE